MDEPMRPNILGPAPSGSALCNRVTEGRVCGRPAAWHVLWVPAENNVVASVCPVHYAMDCELLAIADVHTFGGMCNIPGARWLDSKPGQPGTCAIPLEDDEHEMVHESVLASAGVGR